MRQGSRAGVQEGDGCDLDLGRDVEQAHRNAAAGILSGVIASDWGDLSADKGYPSEVIDVDADIGQVENEKGCKE